MHTLTNLKAHTLLTFYSIYIKGTSVCMSDQHDDNSRDSAMQEKETQMRLPQ